MPTDPKLVRDQFFAAAELPISERAAYLAAHCGDDSELRAAVERLLAAHEQPAGMDSRQVLARFEAERQALALMDHPNIAKVFDGGMTEQGRPFFVMEYVKGVPLTEYCDQARLSLKERLQLFLPVCQAVQSMRIRRGSFIAT